MSCDINLPCFSLASESPYTSTGRGRGHRREQQQRVQQWTQQNVGSREWGRAIRVPAVLHHDPLRQCIRWPLLRLHQGLHYRGMVLLQWPECDQGKLMWGNDITGENDYGGTLSLLCLQWFISPTIFWSFENFWIDVPKVGCHSSYFIVIISQIFTLVSSLNEKTYNYCLVTWCTCLLYI